MKKLFTILLVLFTLSTFGHGGNTCPDTVRCTTDQIILTYNSSPTKYTITKLKLKVNGNDVYLNIDSIVGNTYYFKNNGVSCTDESTKFDLYAGNKRKVKCYETSPLPVTLIEFHAHRIKDSIELCWTTSSEYNNEKFILVQSIKGTSGVEKEIPSTAEQGISNELLTHTYKVPISPRHRYFTLMQTDYDGTTENLGSILISPTLMGEWKGSILAPYNIIGQQIED